MTKSFCFLFCFCTFSLFGQPSPLPEIQVKPLERFSAVQQIAGLRGYDLRARRIVVPAGGKIAEHHHKTRPGIVYVLRGEITEYRGEQARLLKAGDTVIEDVNTVHAYENTGAIPCELIAFDIPESGA